MASTSDFAASAAAGAFAGLATDLTMHPLDTIKTRSQSQGGFRAAGGFRRLFRGFGPAALGSCPSAALFFVVYDAVMARARRRADNPTSSAVASSPTTATGRRDAEVFRAAVVASSAAEAAACMVRAPVDVVKQRLQVGGGMAAALASVAQPSIVARVYAMLLLRDIPFAVVQLPLLEVMRARLISTVGGGATTDDVAATAVAGFVAGGVAAFVTTPIDAVKTRVALGQSAAVAQLGLRGLFAGATSRVAMVSVGGAVFFGSQRWALSRLRSNTT
jgi:solute carrier family 25 S-adenosylmethionine transporter 26